MTLSVLIPSPMTSRGDLATEVMIDSVRMAAVAQEQTRHHSHPVLVTVQRLIVSTKLQQMTDDADACP